MAYLQLAFFCCSLLAACAAQQAACPEGWLQSGDSCYRRTSSKVRHDQLNSVCQQMGGESVSIHSAEENNIVANVAGGAYVWIGLGVTGPNTMEWEDGTSYSYKKFLPPGNRMLNGKFVGAGIFQQSCRRWNYGDVSRLRYGVCKTSVHRGRDTRGAACPEGWLQSGDSCYRRTSSKVRHDQLNSVCQQMGGESVSIHSAEENNIVANVAGGQYVWIGLDVAGPNTMEWEDGTSYSYQKFLPPGNSMLNRKVAGAGIFQQSCRRWNYGDVSRLRYGVCKTSVHRCPRGALERGGYCYIIASERVPWWDAPAACHDTEPDAELANVRVQDWRLNSAIADHFGGSAELLVQVERPSGGTELGRENCTWTTVQYGQRESHTCQFGCAEMYKVLCRRSNIGSTSSPQRTESLTAIIMPVVYKAPPSGDDQASVPEAAQECPPGWAARGGHCLSGPTQPATRAPAEALCQQLNGSRVAAVRGDIDKAALVLRLEGAEEVWVQDERPPSARWPASPSGTLEALVLPGASVLTSDAQIIQRTPDATLPALCEHCQVPCGPDAVTFLGHCYRLLEGKRPLADAARSCTQLGPGGTLVSVESAAENRFVTALAFPAGSRQCGPGELGAWLGLHRASSSVDWLWEDCGEPSAKFWAPGAGNSGTCAVLARDGLWRDSGDCQQQRMLAVCEWDPCGETGQPCPRVPTIPPGPIY